MFLSDITMKNLIDKKKQILDRSILNTQDIEAVEFFDKINFYKIDFAGNNTM